MTDVTDHTGRVVQLHDDILYHVALPPKKTTLYHNAFLGKGLAATVSAMGLADVVTPYSSGGRQNPKELLWDDVRKKIDERLPSRLGAMFLVSSEEHAHAIKAKWFANEERIILRARVAVGSVTFIADAKLLDAAQPDWQTSAERYWKAEASSDPRPEVIVHGRVYFPDWEKPPFGQFAEMLPGS
jgi:hypothetical protein